ncbi:MAG TPA: class I SAM-dependent methyltransferase [Tepidisphaeraceae bacterium]|jgi:SAM-dependent methyltransferase
MSSKGTVEKAVTRAGWALKSFQDWTGYRRRRASFKAETRGAQHYTIEAPQGARPRHTYTIADGKLLTTFQMDQRHRIVERLYPQKLTSLLDIGCCRGWFVINAALRPECERATGIDVVQGFIDAANDAKRVLKLDKAEFHYAFVEDVANDPVKFRTPYQTIVMLNVYHYMYWGSAESDHHQADHDSLLRMLAGICTDRIVFLCPLEVEECPSDISRRAQKHPEWAANYTTEKFMEAASRYFDVSFDSRLGLRPLYLMKKKQTGSSGPQA